MDNQRAIEILEWWIEHANAARAVYEGELQNYADLGTPIMNELREREDLTSQVVRQIMGGNKMPALVVAWQNGRNADLGGGVEIVKYALGRLRTSDEAIAVLGRTGPTMAADGLHPTIWDAASKLWSDGHHGQAVQRAATFLNADIQDKIGRRDVSDVALMGEAFGLGESSAERPRLRWPGADDDLTVRAMRVGILNFSQGVFSAIRNPATHSVDDLPQQEALEQLAALSVLARWIDGCQVVRLVPKK